MSQFAVFRTCQIPFMSGCPSGVRGRYVCADAMLANANMISTSREHRSFTTAILYARTLRCQFSEPSDNTLLSAATKT